MPKKTEVKGLKHHIIHKSRLTLLLVLKVSLILISFFIVMRILSFFSPWVSFNEITPLNILMWAIGLAIAILLYLFLIVRVLDILKFSK
ncbi:MAG: hypothetical protein AABX79_02600 [Nanoarchaeota archaeon]